MNYSLTGTEKLSKKQTQAGGKSEESRSEASSTQLIARSVMWGKQRQ